MAEPAAVELETLSAGDAISVGFVGDEGLKRGDWTYLGPCGNWDRDAWAPPLFSFSLPSLAWAEIREYPEGDPFAKTRSWRVTHEEAAKYPGDGISTSGLDEFELDLLVEPNVKAVEAWIGSFTASMSKPRPDILREGFVPNSGDWFCLRLDRGGWALGRVARSDGIFMVAYLFGPRLPGVPDLSTVYLPSAQESLLVLRTNLAMPRLGQIIWLGSAGTFEPDEWPIPWLKHEITGLGGRRVGLAYTYDTSDLGQVVRCRRATENELSSLSAYKQLTLFGIAYWLDSVLDPLSRP